MSKLKSITENIFLIVMIVLNILDFFEYLNPTFDFIKKIISWTLMIYLLYKFGFTRILIGYKNILIDILLLISYTLFIFKDLFFYLLGSNLNININEYFVFYSLNISLVLMIFTAFYISIYLKIEKNSLLGIFSIENKNFIIKFLVTLISISFVAYFIFMMAFQWFTIVIDAPLVMIALVYYIFAATKYHNAGSVLYNVGKFGDMLIKNFISLFHSRNTLPLGLIGLLTLHFFTDLFVLVIPSFFKMSDFLYHDAISNFSNNTIFELFIQNIRGADVYEFFNLSIVYLSNICFVVVLFLLPLIMIKFIYQKKKIEFHPLDIMFIIPMFIIYFLFPIYKITKYTSLYAQISGVTLKLNPINSFAASNYALLIFLSVIFILLILYRFTKFDKTPITLILIFIPMINYVAKYFSSTLYYYIGLLRSIMELKYLLIMFFFIIFLFLIIMFYWASIALFILETLKLNYKSLLDKVNKEDFNKLIVFLFFGYFLYLALFFISTVFVVFRIDGFDFFIPIILTAVLFALPRINKFFNSINMGFRFKNILFTPMFLIIGFFFGASFIYFNESLVYRSKNILLIIIYLIFVAFSEEILFRHYAFSYLSKVFNYRISNIFQSVLFSLLHLSKGINISLFISLIIFGYGMQMIKERFGLYNAIITHLCANILVYYYFL